MSKVTPASFDWRAHLKVHPAADLFPLKSETELQELADDIHKNGLQSRIMLWRDDREPGTATLIDGRNRLDALACLGWLGPKRERVHRERHEDYALAPPLTIASEFHVPRDGQEFPPDQICSRFHGFEFHTALHDDDDVRRYVIAANIRRRHLTAEQKRDVIAELLKAQPETSNRQIAKTVAADHKTVAAVRCDMEGRGEIPHVETRADSQGRKQPLPDKVKVSGRAISAADFSPAAQTQSAEKTDPEPTSPMAIALDMATTELLQLRTKPLSDFDGSVLSDDDLMRAAEFLSDLLARRKKVAA